MIKHDTLVDILYGASEIYLIEVYSKYKDNSGTYSSPNITKPRKYYVYGAFLRRKRDSNLTI